MTKTEKAKAILSQDGMCEGVDCSRHESNECPLLPHCMTHAPEDFHARRECAREWLSQHDEQPSDMAKLQQIASGSCEHLLCRKCPIVQWCGEHHAEATNGTTHLPPSYREKAARMLSKRAVLDSIVSLQSASMPITGELDILSSALGGFTPSPSPSLVEQRRATRRRLLGLPYGTP